MMLSDFGPYLSQVPLIVRVVPLEPPEVLARVPATRLQVLKKLPHASDVDMRVLQRSDEPVVAGTVDLT